MRRLALFGLGAAVLAAAANGAPPKVKTLAYADSPIVAFARDGNWIAWATAKTCLGRVRIRSLKTKVQRSVGVASPDGDCRFLGQTKLVLGGDRAVWTHHETGNFHYIYVSARRFSERTVHSVTDVSWDMGEYGVGPHFGGLAGDGPLVVYSRIDVSVHGADDCDVTSTCVPYIDGGGVWRFDGRSHVVPDAPPAVLLAASRPLIAIVPAAIGGPTPRAKANGPMQIRNATTGKLISSFAPVGTVRAVALAGDTVAVLVAKQGTKRIERRRARSGKLVFSSVVPAATASRVALDGNGRVVFRVGSSIRTLAPNSNVVATLAIAQAVPLGVSIEGGLVTWAESLKLKGKPAGRIQALDLAG